MYPLRQKIILDCGTEFMAQFANICREDYRIKRHIMTTRNPQSNAIIERIHHTIGNIIRTFNVKKINKDDPWSGNIPSTMFGVHATYHTTLGASPM